MDEDILAAPVPHNLLAPEPGKPLRSLVPVRNPPLPVHEIGPFFQSVKHPLDIPAQSISTPSFELIIMIRNKMEKSKSKRYNNLPLFEREISWSPFFSVEPEIFLTG